MYYARKKLWKTKKSGTVANFNVAFRAALYECMYVSQKEALKKYFYGLKAENSLYLREKNPKTLDKAIR